MLPAFRVASLSILALFAAAQFSFAQFNDGGRQVAKGLPTSRTSDGHIARSIARDLKPVGSEVGCNPVVT
jgi:hypothetical protein